MGKKCRTISKVLYIYNWNDERQKKNETKNNFNNDVWVPIKINGSYQNTYYESSENTKQDKYQTKEKIVEESKEKKGQYL